MTLSVRHNSLLWQIVLSDLVQQLRVHPHPVNSCLLRMHCKMAIQLAVLCAMLCLMTLYSIHYIDT